MQKKVLFALATLALVLVGCKKETTNYSISPNPATVEAGKTVQLVLTPQTSAAWESKNVAVATVDGNGLVTGVSEGQTVVTATIGNVSASVMVNVTKGSGGTTPSGEDPTVDPGTLHKSLQGSEYYIFQLDGVTQAKIQNKIKANLLANDGGDGSNTHSFYIWENTYNAGTTSGRNFYGEAEGWYSFQVLSVGWSGAGLCIHDAAGQPGGVADMNPLSAIMANPADYIFHIAMKSTDNATHLISLGGSAKSEGKVAIGATAFEDNGKLITPVANFTRDGSWGEIEIPMTTFINQGLQYSSNNSGDGINVISFLSGGQAGTMLQFDACFIYKK